MPKPKEEIINLQPEYSDEETKYRGYLIKRLTSAKDQRDANHIEFDDVDYLTYYEENAKAANSYIREKKDEEDTRIVTGTTKEKENSLLSALLNYNFEVDIEAFNKDDLRIDELGETVQDLVRKSRDIEKYELKRPLLYKEALDQGNAFVEEIWYKPTRVKKKLTKIDWSEGVKVGNINWKEKIVKAMGECRVNLLHGTHVFLGNIKEFFIQEQPYVFTVDKIHYSKAEAIYRNWERWKYVPRKIVKVNPDNDVIEYGDWSLLELEEDMVEVIKYQDKWSNEFMIMLNGVLMLPVGFPLPWVGYNLAKCDIEPISWFFAYSKSIPAKTRVDQAVLDETLRLIVLEMQKNFAPPLANNTGRVLGRKIFLPGKITPGINPDLLKPIGDNKGVTQSMIAGYELLKKIIDQKSVQPVFMGETVKGEQTATEIRELKKQSMMKFGLAVLGIMNFEMQLAQLRINNILEHWTDPIDERVDSVKKKIVSVYRKVEVPGAVEGEGRGRRIIEFSPEGVTRSPEQIRAEERILGGVGEPVKKVYLNPKEMKKAIDYNWKINITSTMKDNDDLEKVLFNQNLQSGFNLFGPQSFNLEYWKQRWAEIHKEDYDKAFLRGAISSPVMEGTQPGIAGQQMEGIKSQYGTRPPSPGAATKK